MDRYGVRFAKRLALIFSQLSILTEMNKNYSRRPDVICLLSTETLFILIVYLELLSTAL